MDINISPDKANVPALNTASVNPGIAKEIKALTGLRGIAAIYVAVYHWYRSNTETLHQLPGALQTFIKHGYLSVDMFFILSGFVIALSSKKLFETGITKASYLIFMKRRFSRVYPVYLIITILAFAVLFHFGHIKSLLLNLVLMQTLTSAQYILGPSWSLSAEWFAYLIFPFFFYFAYYSKRPLWSVACLIISFSVLGLISLYFQPFLNGIQSLNETYGPLDRYRGIAAVLRCFAEYLIGITLYKLCAWYQLNFSKHYYRAALLAVLLVFGLLFITATDILIVCLLALLIGSLYIDKGAIARVLGSRSIYFLGLISYSLYLIHPIIIELQKQLYQTLNGHLLYADKISYVTGVFLLIGLSYLTHQYIEVPSRNYTKKLFNI